jgi:hypothetical protein
MHARIRIVMMEMGQTFLLKMVKSSEFTNVVNYQIAIIHQKFLQICYSHCQLLFYYLFLSYFKIYMNNLPLLHVYPEFGY